MLHVARNKKEIKLYGGVKKERTSLCRITRDRQQMDTIKIQKPANRPMKSALPSRLGRRRKRKEGGVQEVKSDLITRWSRPRRLSIR